MRHSTSRPRHLPAIVVTTTFVLTACANDSDVEHATSASSAAAAAGVDEADEPVGSADVGLGAVGTLRSDEVHELTFELDPDEYDEMIAAYSATGDKEWIEATVTIDGTTYEQAGIRLKGNSSLRGLAGGADGPTGDADADDPSSLPWLVKLDKYVDGRSHEGLTDLVVRSNTSETALNEAVALELLEAAGLAAQDAIAVAFAVNGAEPVLRLVIEHPDDVWMSEWLGAGGALYKAESTGDYSFRGNDPESYDEVFDQEAGDDNADLTPLIELLAFLADSDDATFAAELPNRLDVDAFATYLAMQELIDNFDDIDGPGNNSYLYYDTDDDTFTVVPWDHNLAFGVGPSGSRGDAEPGRPPTVGTDGYAGADGPPAGGAVDRRGAPAGGPLGRSNVLVERFLAVDEWQTLVTDRLTELRSALVDGGVAAEVLDSWVDVVTASGLVGDATVAAESQAIADRLAAAAPG